MKAAPKKAKGAPTARPARQGWARRIKTKIRLCRAIYADPETPRAARWLLWLTLAYVLSPIDLIPDFIPVLGYLDDVLIVALALWLVVRLAPRDVYERHTRSLAEDEAALEETNGR